MLLGRLKTKDGSSIILRHKYQPAHHPASCGDYSPTAERHIVRLSLSIQGQLPVVSIGISAHQELLLQENKDVSCNFQIGNGGLFTSCNIDGSLSIC